MRNLILFTLFQLLIVMTAFGQGTITGTILDEETGEALIGANVVIEGTTTGTATDFDGKYQFKADPGIYTIHVSYIGYADKKTPGVEVKDGEITYFDVALGDGAVDLDLDITVKAKVIERSENALLILQKKSDKIQDGISSQEMGKLAISDAAGAMKKVTGATVSGGKYVYIRGLGDRYSLSQLNGLIIPSADPYRNGAQLDLIPASLLDNIITAKTFTPDQPGTFTGGNVDIKTKSFPEQFSLTFGVSTAYNAQNNFNSNFLTHEGGSSDYWGYDDGGRARPEVFESELAEEVLAKSFQLPILTRLNFQDRGRELGTTADELIRSVNSQFAPTTTNSGLDHGYSVAFGNQYNVGNNPLGVIFSASFKQTYRHLDRFEKANYSFFNAENSGELFNQGDFEETTSTQSPTLNGMLGLAYKLNNLNTITFTSIYNHSADKKSRFIFGERPDNIIAPDFLEGRSIDFRERELTSFQLGGTHVIAGLNNAQIEWKAAKANSSLDVPDLRFFENEYNTETEDYSIPSSNVQRPFHFYRDLEDEQYDFKLDLTLPIGSNGTKVKVGGLRTEKDRVFNEYRYQVEDQNASVTPFEGDVEAYLGDDNIGVVEIKENGGYVLGNYLVDRTLLRNFYTGSDKVTAGYGMLTIPIMKDLKFVGGLRVERTELFAESRDTSQEVANIDQVNLLPSWNLIYSLNDNMNLRGSFSQTLARPNMREIAPFESFDPLTKETWFGNPNLKLTKAINFDLRWEWFLSPGEIVAVSGYYKDFTNPITLIYRNAPNPELEYVNVDGGNLFGIELEVRKNLSFISPALKDFKINTNISYIQSKMDVLDQGVGIEQTERPFEGQPTFIFNTALMYSNLDLGLDAVIALNTIGDRLNIIGRDGLPDIYDRGRSQLDFNVTKRLGDVSIKFSAKNLLNDPFKRSSEYLGNEYTYVNFSRGITYGLGVSYTIR